MRFYAVRSGRQPGIYASWADCREQIHGYSGAAFKSFETQQEAEDYLQEPTEKAPIDNNLPAAYIDGSYSSKRGLYSYGGFIRDGTGRPHILQGTGDNADYLPERNIAGELTGAIAAVSEAIALQLPEINLFFDYTGIENYLTGQWTTKTPLAIYYRETMAQLLEQITVHFVAIRGHTGIEGNELADALAKQAAGAQLRKKDTAAIEKLQGEAHRWGGKTFTCG